MFCNFEKFIENLQTAINGELEAIEFYTKLMEMAPCPEVKEYLKHIRDDEKMHYRMFCQLYISLCGSYPVTRKTDVCISDFCEGIKEAITDELNAAHLYRKMYLSTSHMKIRDIMFEAMTDEMMHATRLNFIYSYVDCK